jgi:hypothetical protein
MYYTGLDPRDMKKVYIERNPHRKAMQRALIQYRDPKNYELVKEALLECHRTDLIGYGKECLIPPRPFKSEDKKGKKNRPQDKKEVKTDKKRGKIQGNKKDIRERPVRKDKDKGRKRK